MYIYIYEICKTIHVHIYIYIHKNVYIYIYIYTYIFIYVYTHLSTEIMRNNVVLFVENMGFKLGHFPAAAGIILFTPLILHLYLFVI